MRKYIFIISGLIILSLASSAQETSITIEQQTPITFARSEAKIVDSGTTYKYLDIHAVPVAAAMSEVPQDTLAVYEYFARNLREAMLYTSDYRKSEREVLTRIALARKDAKAGVQPLPQAGPDDFDITKLPLKKALMGVDLYGGFATTMPLGFLSAYSGLSASGTVDGAIYLDRFFVRPSFTFGKTWAKEGQESLLGDVKSSSGRDVPYFAWSVNVGSIILERQKYMLSAFVGAGKERWDYMIGKSYYYRIKGASICEGVEFAYMPHRWMIFTKKEPHYTSLAVRVRVYAGQMFTPSINEVLPSLNASVCVGVYRRDVKKAR